MKSILVVTLVVSLGLLQLGCATSAEKVLDHNRRGVGLQAKGDLEGAIAEYRAALRLEPDYAPPIPTLGPRWRTKGTWRVPSPNSALSSASSLISRPPIPTLGPRWRTKGRSEERRVGKECRSRWS